MISAFFSRLIILVFGTLFPAYYSYKAVRTKDVREYVTWMMYWIVFAFFTCAETITDIFLSFWFPFYYELKILVVLWLLSPATRGSSLLYRKFVHPWLNNRESEIDEYIKRAKHQGYSTVVELGTKGVNYATNVIMATAMKGGGGIMNQIKRSYSTSEIDGRSHEDFNRNVRNNVDILTDDDDVDFNATSTGQDDSRRRTKSLKSDQHDSNMDTEMDEIDDRKRRRHKSNSRAGAAQNKRVTQKNHDTDVEFVDVTYTGVPVIRKSPRTQGQDGERVTGRNKASKRYEYEDPDYFPEYATLPRTTKKRPSRKKI